MKNTITIYENQYAIKSESPRVKIDSWGNASWAILSPGDDYVDESYKGSEYVIDDQFHAERMPVNIRFTGRTLNRKVSCFMDTFVRCEIEFVKDGEPSEFVRGYVEVEWVG